MSYLQSVDQGFEIIGTNNYLSNFDRINNCKYTDEAAKYKLIKHINERRSKSKEPDCMCAKQWRYEADFPLYYKGPIKDVNWKPHNTYCNSDTLTKDLDKIPNEVKIINTGIDYSQQNKLKELDREYKYNYSIKNNVQECSESKFKERSDYTDPKWGFSMSNTVMYGDKLKPKREYWHKLSEKDYLRNYDRFKKIKQKI